MTEACSAQELNLEGRIGRLSIEELEAYFEERINDPILTKDEVKALVSKSTEPVAPSLDCNYIAYAKSAYARVVLTKRMKNFLMAHKGKRYKLNEIIEQMAQKGGSLKNIREWEASLREIFPSYVRERQHEKNNIVCIVERLAYTYRYSKKCSDEKRREIKKGICYIENCNKNCPVYWKEKTVNQKGISAQV